MQMEHLRTSARLLRHPLFARPLPRWCVFLAIAFLVGSWIATVAIPNIPGATAVVVHYTATFGVDALGSWGDLFRFPVVGSVLVGFNIVLAVLLTQRRAEAPTQASMVLLVAAVLIAFAVCIGMVLLLRVNVLYSISL